MSQPFHPIADLFPLMEGRDFAALVEDVKANGLRHPITVDAGGRIVDGRNRYRACEQGRVAPAFVTWTGTEEQLPAFVASENLHRRHLTSEERAFIGARLANMKRGNPQFHQPVELGACGRGMAPRKEGPPSGEPSKALISQAQAAAVMNVPRRAVDKASSILRSAPDLEPKVVRGEMSMEAARTEAVRRTKAPTEAPARHPINFKKHHAKADEMVRRAITALEGICAGLAEIDTEKVSADDAPGWAVAIEQSAGEIRRFARRLRV